jgi:hypothetical protein
VVPLQLQLLDTERTSGAAIGAQTITNCYDAVGTPTASKEKRRTTAELCRQAAIDGGGRQQGVLRGPGNGLNDQLTTATIDVGGTGNVGLPRSSSLVTPANNFFGSTSPPSARSTSRQLRHRRCVRSSK